MRRPSSRPTPTTSQERTGSCLKRWTGSTCTGGARATNSTKGVALEGELAHYTGDASRGNLAKNNNWRDACLFVWDAPELDGPYEERLQHLIELEKGWNKRFVRVVPLLGPATSHKKLAATLKRVVARGGEGLMIRDPIGGTLFTQNKNQRLLTPSVLF